MSLESVKEAGMEDRERGKGFRKFYIFPLLYAASAYLVPALFMITGKTYYICLPAVFGAVNIIACCKFCKAENRRMMFRAAVLLKTALVLFYGAGGILAALALAASLMPVPFMIILGPALAVAGSAWGWVILALETPYMIAYLYLSCKDRMMPRYMAVVHAVLQFIFVADVVDVIFLGFTEYRRKEER